MNLTFVGVLLACILGTSLAEIQDQRRAVIYGVNNHDGGIINKRAVIYGVNNHDGGIIFKRAVIHGLYNMPDGNQQLDNSAGAGGRIGPAVITGGVDNHDGGVIF